REPVADGQPRARARGEADHEQLTSIRKCRLQTFHGARSRRDRPSVALRRTSASARRDRTAAPPASSACTSEASSAGLVTRLPSPQRARAIAAAIERCRCCAADALALSNHTLAAVLSGLALMLLCVRRGGVDMSRVRTVQSFAIGALVFLGSTGFAVADGGSI